MGKDITLNDIYFGRADGKTCEKYFVVFHTFFMRASTSLHI